MRRVPKGALGVAVLALLLFAAPSAYANACVSNATGNWGTAATWTACGGVVPTSADTVEISGGFTVIVNVSNAVAASLTVSKATFPTSAGTLVFNSGSQVTVSGTVTFGSSQVGSDATIIMTNGGTLIANGLAVGTGLASVRIWTPGTGTVELKAANTLPATIFTTFNNLTVTTGTTTLGVNIAVNGTLTQTAGIAVGTRTLTVAGTGTHNAGTSTVSGAGGYTLASGATLLSGHTGGMGGNITTTTKTLNTAANYTFNGTSAQVTSATMPATVNNLTTNNSAGVTLSANVVVSSNLTVTTGTLVLGSFTANRASAGGTLTVSNGGTLKIGGTNTLPSNYSTHSIGATSTVEYSGTDQTLALLNSSQDYGHLTISGSGTKTLAGSENVVGTLTFTSGTITTGGNTLYLTSNGTVARTSGHVIGNFKKNIALGATSKTFEVGDAGNYTPAFVSFASVTTAGDLTASVVSGDHANIGTSTINAAKSVNRNWTLTNSGIVFTTYDATFTFVAGVPVDLDAGATTSAFIVGKYSGGSWTYPTVGTKTATTTQATGLTAFSDFQLGEAAAATYSISGTVFEDQNYGGGAGRSLASSSGAVVPSARVELFTAGNYTTFATTDGSGNYSFSGLAAASYTVRVVNGTVNSSRTGTEVLPPVQTYRTNASSGTAVPVTDRVGGEVPASVDAGNGSTTLAALTAGAVTPQSITTVVLGASNITGVEFGYSYNVIVNKNNTGQGSLRQFLLNANALSNTGLAQSGLTAGIDNAVFMLADGAARPGLTASYATMFVSSIATVAVASELPSITDPVSIDATLQPGYSLTPMIELDGTSTVSVSGLTITAGSSKVSGLIINRFGSNGIDIKTNGGNIITANYTGTNAAGTAASANNNAGIYIGSANNIIGGTSSASRNIISGNNFYGISILGAGATGNTVQGNYIGINAAGSGVIANTYGIAIDFGASSNTIGGTASGAANVISGNSNSGVLIFNAGSSNNTILGNYIGTNAAGTSALPNVRGVYISASADNNTIGGTAAGAGNLIYGNGAPGGVLIDAACTGNAILNNSIYGNTGIGIDLLAVAAANNGTKTGTLANSGMDSAVFTTASLSGTTLTLVGYVGSAPNQVLFASAIVQVFESDLDATGFGEGQTFLGTLTADASGNLSGTLTVSGLAVGDKITGTATDASNNTSEFGANFTVAASATYSISGTVFEDKNYGGGAGRDLASSSGTAVPSARVELYTGSNYTTFATTDASGNYTFPGLAAATYTVRVVNGTVNSSRTGTEVLPPVQTYRTNASSGTAVAVTDRVGGEVPASVDAGNGSTTLAALTVGAVTPQSMTGVVLGASNITGVEFGYSYNVIVNKNNTGQGSLRQFLLNANALSNTGLAQSGLTAGKDNAVFMLADGTARPGLTASYATQFTAGIASITLASALATISDPVILDASLQPGYSSVPMIELNGNAVVTTAGLTITAGSSTVRGFIINRITSVTGNGISLTISGGNTITGNYIGTNAAGTAASANGNQGINITSANNIIGGTTAAARNIISGNGSGSTSAGVYITGASATGNVVQGNYIGTNVAGTAAIANVRYGIYLLASASSNTIGGTAAGARNVISGNSLHGVVFQSVGTSGNILQGNYIGTNAAGTAAIANGDTGVLSDYANNNTIGGTAAGAGNVISGNALYGVFLQYGAGPNIVQGNYIGTNAAGTAALPNVSIGIGVYLESNVTIGGTAAGAGNLISGNGKGIAVVTGTGNAILSNSIYTNTALGIDLTDNGVTANNGTKSGTLANSDMDHPVFTTASLSGTTLTLAGYVGSAPSQALFAGATVQVFKSDLDATSFGEGQTFLGTLTTDASGNLSGTLTVSGLAAGDKITGTATDATNNTSEFGANATVADPPPNVALLNSVTPSGTQPPGTDLVYTVAFTNGGGQAAQVFIVVDPIPTNTDFKLGSPSTVLGTTGMTVAVEYSNDNAATWTYTPVSGGGGALAGYDRAVTDVRWRFTGNLSQTSPNNTGSVSLTSRIR